jgi:TfoX/Sxy family transcriptional regulator of competence genes
MPTMPKADPDTIRRFERLVGRHADVTLRPMFGHRAAFVRGHMFAGTFGPDIVVRLDEAERQTLLAIEGARPFEPMPGRPMKDFVVLPRAWASGRTPADTWVRRALAWALTLPPKVPAAKPKPSRAATGGRRASGARGRPARKSGR